MSWMRPTFNRVESKKLQDFASECQEKNDNFNAWLYDIASATVSYSAYESGGTWDSFMCGVELGKSLVSDEVEVFAIKDLEYPNDAELYFIGTEEEVLQRLKDLWEELNADG